MTLGMAAWMVGCLILGGVTGWIAGLAVNVDDFFKQIDDAGGGSE